MPDRSPLISIDPELHPGARNAIRVCLRLKPDERITIITDEATREIAAALQAEVEEVGAEHAVFVLEELRLAPAYRNAGDHSRRSGAIAGAAFFARKRSAANSVRACR